MPEILSVENPQNIDALASWVLRLAGAHHPRKSLVDIALVVGLADKPAVQVPRLVISWWGDGVVERRGDVEVASLVEADDLGVTCWLEEGKRHVRRWLVVEGQGLGFCGNG